MQPIVQFVAADDKGIIDRETWRATAYACPRCGKQHGNVWALFSEPVIVINGHETRVFLCIVCQFVALGLNGFKVNWDTARRAQQIIAQAFPEEEENDTVRDPDSRATVLR